MGLHLQFNQGQQVEAWVQEKALSQLHNALTRLEDWDMKTLHEEGFVRARFFKKEAGSDGGF